MLTGASRAFLRADLATAEATSSNGGLLMRSRRDVRFPLSGKGGNSTKCVLLYEEPRKTQMEINMEASGLRSLYSMPLDH